MRNVCSWIVLTLVAACGSESDLALESIDGETNELRGTHYSLNIVGKPNHLLNVKVNGCEGPRIFVPLASSTRINLSEGPFSVLDAEGTDGVASFQLPSPDPDDDGVTTYSVWARALGKPSGAASVTTCLEDNVGETYCSLYTTVLVRERSKSRFSKVSRSLLYVYADVDGDGDVERTSLFSDMLADNYWKFENGGLRLAQLRFYEMPADVN